METLKLQPVIVRYISYLTLATVTLVMAFTALAMFGFALPMELVSPLAALIAAMGTGAVVARWAGRAPQGREALRLTGVLSLVNVAFSVVLFTLFVLAVPELLWLVAERLGYGTWAIMFLLDVAITLVATRIGLAIGMPSIKPAAGDEPGEIEPGAETGAA